MDSIRFWMVVTFSNADWSESVSIDFFIDFTGTDGIVYQVASVSCLLKKADESHLFVKLLC